MELDRKLLSQSGLNRVLTSGWCSIKVELVEEGCGFLRWLLLSRGVLSLNVCLTRDVPGVVYMKVGIKGTILRIVVFLVRVKGLSVKLFSFALKMALRQCYPGGYSGMVEMNVIPETITHQIRSDTHFMWSRLLGPCFRKEKQKKMNLLH